MHTSGKVFLWFVVVLSLAAVWLTAELYTARAHHVRQKVKGEADYEKNVLELDKLRYQAKRSRADVAAALLGWDRTWDDVVVENVLEMVEHALVHRREPAGGQAMSQSFVSSHHLRHIAQNDTQNNQNDGSDTHRAADHDRQMRFNPLH